MRFEVKRQAWTICFAALRSIYRDHGLLVPLNSPSVQPNIKDALAKLPSMDGEKIVVEQYKKCSKADKFQLL